MNDDTVLKLFGALETKIDELPQKMESAMKRRIRSHKKRCVAAAQCPPSGTNHSAPAVSSRQQPSPFPDLDPAKSIPAWKLWFMLVISLGIAAFAAWEESVTKRPATPPAISQPKGGN